MCPPCRCRLHVCVLPACIMMGCSRAVLFVMLHAQAMREALKYLSKSKSEDRDLRVSQVQALSPLMSLPAQLAGTDLYHCWSGPASAGAIMLFFHRRCSTVSQWLRSL